MMRGAKTRTVFKVLGVLCILAGLGGRLLAQWMAGWT